MKLLNIVEKKSKFLSTIQIQRKEKVQIYTNMTSWLQLIKHLEQNIEIMSLKKKKEKCGYLIINFEEWFLMKPII